jgi:hypothetical protein
VRPEINAHLGAELVVEGETWPVFIWTIDHPAGRVLVDTGMIDSRPEVDDMSPTPHPENIPHDVVCLINTHLHFDHCGGNRLFPGVPIHVQARELADARSLDYTIREWVDFDGSTYVEHDRRRDRRRHARSRRGRGHVVPRARKRYDRGPAPCARARSVDVAHPRAGAGDPGTSPVDAARPRSPMVAGCAPADEERSWNGGTRRLPAARPRLRASRRGCSREPAPRAACPARAGCR